MRALNPVRRQTQCEHSQRFTRLSSLAWPFVVYSLCSCQRGRSLAGAGLIIRSRLCVDLKDLLYSSGVSSATQCLDVNAATLVL